MSGFDPHAWIRRFETAGGKLTVDEKAWGSSFNADENFVWPTWAAELHKAVSGGSANRREMRLAIHRALLWRQRQPELCP